MIRKPINNNREVARFAHLGIWHRPAQSNRVLKLCTAVLLVCVLVLTSCAGADPEQPSAEVLGVSIVTTAFGTAQIQSLSDGVNVQVLEAAQPGDHSIALARDGSIVTSKDVFGDETVKLSASPGTYEVWAVTVGESDSNAATGGVRLAPTQRIDRLGSVTIG